MLLLDAEHRYTLNGVVVPGVTNVLSDAGLLDLSMANKATLEVAMERGRIVHRLTELYDHDDLEPDSIEPGFAGYLAAWRRFRVECNFVPDLIECKVHHPIYGYAGTLDRTGTLDGLTSLLDIKTGAPQKATGPQTAAYAEASGLKSKVPRIGVYLQSDGLYVMRHYKEKSDFSVFLAALTLYNFKRNP